jgi:hypothetical protein
MVIYSHSITKVFYNRLNIYLIRLKAKQLVKGELKIFDIKNSCKNKRPTINCGSLKSSVMVVSLW